MRTLSLILIAPITGCLHVFEYGFFHVTTLKKNRKKMAKIAMRNFMIKFYQCIVIYSPQISLLNMKNQND